jgi:uncharacterized protein
MISSVISKPLVKAGWLRALLYLLAMAIVGGTVLSVFVLGMYKSNMNASGLQDILNGIHPEMIFLIFFAVTLIVTYVFRRWVDRRSVISLGLELKDHWREAGAGASMAVFIIGGSTLILQLTGHLKWMDILFEPQPIFLAFGSVVIIAFCEELIFRGYLLSNLLESFPNWLALCMSAVLFMLFHWNANGFFPMFNMLIVGGITGLFYIYNRNLWFPVCFHAAWKFMSGPVLGFSNDPASQSLLQATLQGNANVTGGVAGLQGSMILTVISLFSLLVLYLILHKKISPVSQPVPGRK